MLGWRRVVASDDDLNLGEDFLSCCLVRANEVKSTCTLTVQTHNLGEGLSDDHLEALINEKAQSEGIPVKGTRSEALIGSVEEGIELTAFANISNLLPLSFSRVDAGGVVGTSMEQDARSGSCSIQISEHTVDIQSLGCLVKVSILAD